MLLVLLARESVCDGGTCVERLYSLPANRKPYSHEECFKDNTDLLKSPSILCTHGAVSEDVS